jgi:hypothetical protein
LINIGYDDKYIGKEFKNMEHDNKKLKYIQETNFFNDLKLKIKNVYVSKDSSIFLMSLIFLIFFKILLNFFSFFF